MDVAHRLLHLAVFEPFLRRLDMTDTTATAEETSDRCRCAANQAPVRHRLHGAPISCSLRERHTFERTTRVRVSQQVHAARNRPTRTAVVTTRKFALALSCAIADIAVFAKDPFAGRAIRHVDTGASGLVTLLTMFLTQGGPIVAMISSDRVRDANSRICMAWRWVTADRYARDGAVNLSTGFAPGASGRTGTGSRITEFAW